MCAPHDSSHALTRNPRVQYSSAMQSPRDRSCPDLSPWPAPTPALRAGCYAPAPVASTTAPDWGRLVLAELVRPAPESSEHGLLASSPVHHWQPAGPVQTRG